MSMDKEQRREYMREYYKKNRDKFNDWEKIKSDPDKLAAYREKRRKNKAGGEAYRNTRKKILEELGGKMCPMRHHRKP